MQTIRLKGPALIDGAIRYPVEGDIAVRDADADRQRDNKNVVEGDDDEGGDDAPSDGLEEQKVEDLKVLASTEGVTLGDAKTKPDIIAAIRARRAGAGK